MIGEENPDHPGIYRFSSTDGYDTKHAHILSQDVDIADAGEINEPRPGTPCVAVMSSDGAQCFVIGFHRPPKFDDQSDDPPDVGKPEDNAIAGDKVYKTAGGATLIMKRGGAMIMEAGPGTSIIMNPLNNKMSIRSKNFAHSVDGHVVQAGRKEIGSTEPATVYRADYQQQVGPTFDRWRQEIGDVGDGIRHRIELSEVKIVASREIVTTKTREYYDSDGNWIGEGPSYKWGGPDADEPHVLGKQLVEAISELIDIIKNLKVNTAWGPSTTPLPPTPIQLDQLKNQLSDKILSTYLFLTKEPVEFSLVPGF